MTACADGGVSTLHAALEAVAANGRIRVCPGTYEAMIATRPVRIVAEGGSEVTFLTNGVIVEFPSGTSTPPAG